MRTTGHPWHPRTWARERESNSTHPCPSVKCPAHCHNQELAITKRKPRAVCVGSVRNTRAERAGIQHEKPALAWPGRTHIPRVCPRKKLVWAGCPCTALSLLHGLGSGQGPQNRHASTSSNTTYTTTRTKALSARENEKERQLRVVERERKLSRSTM